MGGGLMETGIVPAMPAKKSSLTPKAIIHQKFGDKACYKVEEVQEENKNGCPGLAIPQKGPCLYRCTLQLPELLVVSDTFKKKKDAEQSAAEKALEKLCIHQKEYNPTVQEAWDDLAGRLSYLFATEFLSSLHPLSGHFRAALQREGHLSGSVPVSVIATYDAKISTICKYINSEAESNFLLVLSLVLRAASKLDDLIFSVEEQLSLQRRNPLLPETMHALVNQESRLSESLSIEVIRIPSSLEKTVESLALPISANGYYVDVIAQALGVSEAAKVFISRTIGKASSDMRLYYNAPECLLMDQLSEPHVNLAIHDKGSLNARASYLSGQEVLGDAILAAVGYSWKSSDLFHEDISLRTYYRLLINMMPSGVYKLSREAVLAAELPMAYTTRSNWRGSFPRDILCTFCRVHRLSEPVFESSIDLAGSHKKLKVESVKKDTNGASIASTCGKSTGTVGDFKCEIKIFSKCQELILQYSPKESYKKQTDAMQNSALKVLSWLNVFFEKPDMAETLKSSAEKVGIQFSPDIFSKEFVLCRAVHKFSSTRHQSSKPINYSCINQPNNTVNDKACSICGENTGITASNGSLACVSYSISLITEGEVLKEHIESSETYEFEIGSEAVISRLEAVVTQMSVGQSAFFHMDLLPQEFILAAAGDSAATLSLLSSRMCILECAVTLLQVTEPLEERMEQALFSPSLSKQRVEFAVQHIRESRATSLVDFGCGSGSLLDSLLDYSTSLEKIAGVDISKKGLARAAKTLHPKLNRNSCAEKPINEIKSVLLYEGSVTNFDSRLFGFDIGTCLEVIEHMEEEDASLFGDVVLKSFCPRILIVSTPNYEYNMILQKSTSSGQEEDDPDEKNQPKFRNHDHKFEWTRAQFNHWASDLAARHNYDVKFSGVGGKADVEPGFASQIAIFRRESSLKNVESEHHYESIWEWSSHGIHNM